MAISTAALCPIAGFVTSSHVVEPKYPYVVEKYLNLGQFCHPEKIENQTGAQLKAAFDEYKQCYAGVYRCIKAARFVSDDAFNTVFQPGIPAKIAKRTKGIIKREIPAAQKLPASDHWQHSGKEVRRFLSAISPLGNVYLKETALELCNKIYELTDTYGLSQFMLNQLKNAAIAAGHTVIGCYCPMNPENKLEHLIIPALSLGFFTVHSNMEPFDAPYRRIHLDSYLDGEILKTNKQRLKFMRRTCASLLDEAVMNLKAAKTIHDRIEAYYNPAINFDGLYAAADSIGRSLCERYL